MDTGPKGRKRWGAAGPVHDRARPSLYRTMKENSHRVPQVCEESDDKTLSYTVTRRLDGHTLYNATDVHGRGVSEAGSPPASTPRRSVRTGRRAAQGPRQPAQIFSLLSGRVTTPLIRQLPPSR